MNEHEQDAFQAEAEIERREQPARYRFKPRVRVRRWGNATIEAQRSNRMAIELQREVDDHRRMEEYGS